MDTARCWTLQQIGYLLHIIPVSMNFILYWTIGSSRIDDKIIYSWCFNFVECFDLPSSITIWPCFVTLYVLTMRSKNPRALKENMRGTWVDKDKRERDDES